MVTALRSTDMAKMGRRRLCDSDVPDADAARKSVIASLDFFKTGDAKNGVAQARLAIRFLALIDERARREEGDDGEIEDPLLRALAAFRIGKPAKTIVGYLREALARARVAAQDELTLDVTDDGDDE